MRLPLLLYVLAAGALFAQTPPASSKPRTAKPAASATKPSGSTPAATKPETAKGSAAAPQQAPAAASAATTPGVPSAVPPDKVVLTIGTEKLTAKDYDEFIESLPEQYRSQARGPMKRSIAEQFARVKLLAAEARRRGLDKDKGVQARIAFQVENMLAGIAYGDIQSKTAIDDALMKQFYEQHKNDYESVEARHVLIRGKGSPMPLKTGSQELSDEQALAKAQEIRKRLVGGEDFAKIAKDESDDTGSGANGGSLGNFKRGQMVAAFEQAAFSLPVGQLSEPIKTQFGYHIIRVDKHDIKPLEEVRSDVEQRIRPDIARQAVEKLVQGAAVTLDEAYFGPVQPQPPAGAVPPGTPMPGVK